MCYQTGLVIFIDWEQGAQVVQGHCQSMMKHHLSPSALQRATEVSIREGAQQLPGSWIHHQQAADSFPSQLLQGLRQASITSANTHDTRYIQGSSLLSSTIVLARREYGAAN